MKVTVIVDEKSGIDDEEEHHKVTMTLPAKWLDGPIEQLKNFFVKNYNKKKDKELSPEEWRLAIDDKSPFARKPHKKLEDTAVVRDVLLNKQDIYLLPAIDKVFSSRPEGTNLCKNHGCQQYFKEDANHDEACCHHAQAPIFHDTRKWWTCCPETKVYEFDELLAIPGCVKSRHSTEPPPPPPSVVSEGAQQSQKMENLHLETSGGPAPASAPPPPKPKPKRVVKEGYGYCVNFGCNIDFELASNHPTACRYHTATPTFRFGKQKWECCNVETFDFDDCMKVPGCEVGPHRVEGDE